MALNPVKKKSTKKVYDCKVCGLSNNRLTNHGNLDEAEILIIADILEPLDFRYGRILSGRTGRLLNNSLINSKVELKKIYTTSIMLCELPPRSKEPKLEQIKSCGVNILKTIDDMPNLKLIITLGKWPLKFFLNKSDVKKVRGELFKKDNLNIFPMQDPSYILDNPGERELFEKDFAKAKLIVEGKSSNKDIKYTMCNSIADVKAAQKKLNAAKMWAFDIESRGGEYGLDLYSDNNFVTTVAFTTDNKENICIPVDHPGSTIEDRNLLITILRDIFSQDNKKIAHNAAFDVKGMKLLLGIDTNNLYACTALMSSLVNQGDGSSNSLKRLSIDLLGYPSDYSIISGNTELDKEPLKKVAKYNCLGGDTLVTTKEYGIIPIEKLKNKKVHIIDGNGSWALAECKSYGKQNLYNIKINLGKDSWDIKATKDHRWFTKSNKETSTSQLTTGDRLVSISMPKRISVDDSSDDYKKGVVHGIVYGDGTALYKQSSGKDSKRTLAQRICRGFAIRLCADSKELLGYFKEYPNSYPKSYEGDPVCYINNSAIDLKDLPDTSTRFFTDEYILGFIRGWMAADGHVTLNGEVSLAAINSGKDWLYKNAPRYSFYITKEYQFPDETNLGKRKNDLFRISFDRRWLDDSDFLLTKKRKRFKKVGPNKNSFGTIASIENLDTIEDVFCFEVPSTKSFVLTRNLLTGNCEDTENTLEIYDILLNELKALKLDTLFFDVVMKGRGALNDIELTGSKIDTEYGEKLSIEYEEKRKEKFEDLNSHIPKEKKLQMFLDGKDFNLKSNDHLAYLLFDVFGLPLLKKTASGKRSVDAETLKSLKGKHLFVDSLLEYKLYEKCISTYVTPLMNKHLKKDGKIHCNYRQDSTVSGRLSSSNPNLQNIPSRGAIGKQVKSLFIPSYENSYLLQADYSQIELRVAAIMANEPTMLDIYGKAGDIHAMTAAATLGIPIEEVSDADRQAAKAINFGFIYGMSAKGFMFYAKQSYDVTYTLNEAEQIRNNYFNTYSKLPTWYDRTLKFARQHGYVENLFGRRRKLINIGAHNSFIRGKAERQAINSPVQSTAADICLLAIYNINNFLKKKNMKSRIVNTVHDSIILEVPENELMDTAKIVKTMMERVPLPFEKTIPLTSDLEYGRSWGSLKKLTI